MRNKIVFALIASVSIFAGISNIIAEIEHRTSIGGFEVIAWKDGFTDEFSIFLETHKGRKIEIGNAGFRLSCSKNELAVLLYSNGRDNKESEVQIKVRFDKDEPLIAKWQWVARTIEEKFVGVAKSNSIDDHNYFMNGVIKSKRLIYQVGQDIYSVELENGGEAVARYAKQCSDIGREMK